MSSKPPTYRPQAMSPARIQQAAEAWLRASFAFQLGAPGRPAYGDETTEWYTTACEELCRALTGEADLKAAGKVLGLSPVPHSRRKR